ncbi:uncharacterized protein N7458_002568 [Penicillium daleae]|uniref:Cyanovirin-N domain-containing protein n=1 Tax=Penicillium daleae TaxID=63821 RepID=A0AAD6G6C4_9EURO|nr:uncharacterized protein N7458_002568 [Penicillium daleae]KAJ5461016.1 hypothetical protein N7458_002568 [Penicillium daleae]
MDFLYYAPFLCLFANVALSGSLIVINNNGQCMIWSESNYGCTGYSASFARLDGKNCSNFAMNGTQVNNETLKLDICGTENGRQVAWVKINRNGAVSFLNQQGTTATCALDDDFNVGSKCSVMDIGQSQSATTIPTTRQISIATPTASQSGASVSTKDSSSTSWPSSVAKCTCDLIHS